MIQKILRYIAYLRLAWYKVPKEHRDELLDIAEEKVNEELNNAIEGE